MEEKKRTGHGGCLVPGGGHAWTGRMGLLPAPSLPFLPCLYFLREGGGIGRKEEVEGTGWWRWPSLPATTTLPGWVVSVFSVVLHACNMQHLYYYVPTCRGRWMVCWLMDSPQFPTFIPHHTTEPLTPCRPHTSPTTPPPPPHTCLPYHIYLHSPTHPNIHTYHYILFYLPTTCVGPCCSH